MSSKIWHVWQLRNGNKSIKCEGIALREWLTGHAAIQSQSSQSVYNILMIYSRMGLRKCFTGSSRVTESQNADKIRNVSWVQDKQLHFEQPDSDIECIHISNPLKRSLHENNGVSFLVNTGVSHNVPCNVGSQGEQIKLG